MTSNGAAVRKRLRLPLIAALALAFISLSLISGIAYIVVLAGATNTAEKFAARPRRPGRRRPDGIDQDQARCRHRPSADGRRARRQRPPRHQLASRHARGAVGDDDPGAGDLECRLRHLRPQAGARRPPSRRPGDPRHRLPGRPAARPGTLPRAADLAMSPSGARCSGTTSCSSRCSTSARRSGASTTPSSAACWPRWRSATCRC